MKTDKQLQQDVFAELEWELSVNAAHIGVEVQDGIVTPAGPVDSYVEKWDAERAAQRACQRVAGAKALAVEMDVKLPSDSRDNNSAPVYVFNTPSEAEDAILPLGTVLAHAKPWETA